MRPNSFKLNYNIFNFLFPRNDALNFNFSNSNFILYFAVNGLINLLITSQFIANINNIRIFKKSLKASFVLLKRIGLVCIKLNVFVLQLFNSIFFKYFVIKKNFFNS